MMKKLVRDYIPEICELENPGQHNFRQVVDQNELRILLIQKLREESEELVKELAYQNIENIPEEIFDVICVVEKICDTFNISDERIQAIAQRKSEMKGLFLENWVMETKS